jgi:hypothetical protein
MAEKIDILFLPPVAAPFFDVVVANPSVPIESPVLTPPDYSLLFSTGEQSIFERGDNFTILSCGFILPESFVLSSSPTGTLQKCPRILLGLQEAAASTVHYIPEIGSLSGIAVPMENFENGVGIFINVKSIYDARFRLYCKLVLDPAVPAYPQVSMQGCPAGLDATRQLVTVFLKIVHNSALVG